MFELSKTSFRTAKERISFIRNKWESPAKKLRKNSKRQGSVDIEQAQQSRVLVPQDPTSIHGLRVSITGRFEAPLERICFRELKVPSAYEIDDEALEALLSSIERSTREIIVRPELRADDPVLETSPYLKRARYNLSFRVDKLGQPSTEQDFTSFQDEELSVADMERVMIEAEQIVSLFLQSRNPHYRWSWPMDNPRQRDDCALMASTRQITPQSMHCIPVKFGTPGYSIEVVVKGNSGGKSQSRVINVASCQDSPLTTRLGEDLTRKATRVLHQARQHRESLFGPQHRSCDGLEGADDCKYHENGTFDMMLQVRNHLGREHLHWTAYVASSRALFDDNADPALDRFVARLSAQLWTLRDEADNSMTKIHDLRIDVMSLRGNAWEVQNPLTVTVDGSTLYCRSVTEAVLEKAQSRICQILANHDSSITMTVHKRGHLIIDSTLRGKEQRKGTTIFPTSEAEQRHVREKLKDAISTSLLTVLKDTCSFHHSDTHPNLRFDDSRAQFSELEPENDPEDLVPTPKADLRPQGTVIWRPECAIYEEIDPFSPSSPSSSEDEFVSAESSPLIELPSCEQFTSPAFNTLGRSCVPLKKRRECLVPERAVSSLYSSDGMEGNRNDIDRKSSAYTSIPSLTDVDSIHRRDGAQTPDSLLTPCTAEFGIFEPLDEVERFSIEELTRPLDIMPETIELAECLANLHHARLGAAKTQMLSIEGDKTPFKFASLEHAIRSAQARRFARAITSPLELLRTIGHSPDQMVQMSLRHVVMPHTMRRQT